MIFGFIPFRKKPQTNNKSNSSYASYLSFFTKKMEEMGVCMCVFISSAYNPFLTAVIHRNQWKRQLKKKHPTACFYP